MDPVVREIEMELLGYGSARLPDHLPVNGGVEARLAREADAAPGLPLAKRSAPRLPAEVREKRGARRVDLIGLEPTTSSMPWKRSPN